MNLVHDAIFKRREKMTMAEYYWAQRTQLAPANRPSLLSPWYDEKILPMSMTIRRVRSTQSPALVEEVKDVQSLLLRSLALLN